MMDRPKIDQKDVKEFAKDGFKFRGVFSEVHFEREFVVYITIRKMISRFLKTGEINDKLLINNIICTLNSFGIKKANVIFRLMCSDVQYSVVKAILMFLRCYDFSVGEDVYPNRIIVDILKDVSTRYSLDHL
jgi:hypothetical protein